MGGRKVTKIPKTRGVYIAARPIRAFKGMKKVHAGGLLEPAVVSVTIPKGAVIVITPSGDKFRVSAFKINGPPARYRSPVKGCKYESGVTYTLTRINRDSEITCASGFHLCPTAKDAFEWSRW